jgi:hypothetical protein
LALTERKRASVYADVDQLCRFSEGIVKNWLLSEAWLSCGRRSDGTECVLCPKFSDCLASSIRVRLCGGTVRKGVWCVTGHNDGTSEAL